jgi:hypothetical protein
MGSFQRVSQFREALGALVFKDAIFPRFGNANAEGSNAGGPVEAMNRRYFLASGAAFGASLAASQPVNSETVYRFAAGDCDIRMTVEFFDNYSARGFWFKERMRQRRFCVSGTGEENRDCVPNFTGAIAIARYHVRCHSARPRGLALIERVRTIDQDSRLSSREPFERTIELQDGIASDIQAFGYQVDNSPASSESAAGNGPWCLLRQDLFLRSEESLLLVIHWKHTTSAIRLFDVIPGDRTRLIAEPEDSKRRVR